MIMKNVDVKANKKSQTMTVHILLLIFHGIVRVIWAEINRKLGFDGKDGLIVC